MPGGPESGPLLSRISRISGWLSSNTGSLTTRVFRGGVWLFAGNMLNRVAGLVKIALLARLLAPADFGLMGIAMMALQWLEFFTQSGFNTALIQRAADPRPYLHTAWTVQMLRGAGLALLLALGAPVAARFFENPEAAPLIRAIALVLLLRGLTSPAVIFLRRELNFRRETFWRLSGTVANLVAAIVLGLVYRNVWALTASVIVGQAVETVVSYWVQPYRPRLEFDRALSRELMKIGKWVFWGNLLLFFCNYLDRILVVKLLGTTALGFYEMAVQLALFPSAQIGVYLRGLMLPAFAKLERTEDLRRAFLRSFGLLCLVVIPIASFLTIFAVPVIRLTVGDRWTGIAPVVQVLAWTGAANALAELMWPMVLKLERGKLAAASLLLRLLLLVACAYPLLQAMGSRGVAWATLLGSLAALGYLLVHTSRLLGIGVRHWAQAYSGVLMRKK